ncbi:MAG TPA: AAA family ATPase [Bdellovibrionota bacterium]|nr:AAA family ATPase [Bdellovibrionota bacterium]
MPCLYIFSGLPGSGKSTLARALSQHLRAAYVRIDTIEQALRDACGITDIGGKGYELAYAFARDILSAGSDAVADSVNPLTITRRAWESAATSGGARFVNIEVVCADPAEHRRRVEGRRSEVPGLKLPTWDQVVSREYEPWKNSVPRIDTARRSVEACLSDLLSEVQ